MLQQTSCTVDAILLRSKKGPYNKLAKTNRQNKVLQMYFEDGYSIFEIAKKLGSHRNTISSDVKYWIKEFDRLGGEDKITEFFYKQKSLFDSQKLRLLKKLKEASDFGAMYKIEKLLLVLHDKEMKFYLKFKPKVGPTRPDLKIIKKIIRDLAFSEFSYLIENDLIRAIIDKTKCDVSFAMQIVYEMRILGLDYSKRFGEEGGSMIEFGKICGCLSEKEYSQIKERIALRHKKEEEEYQKRVEKYKTEFKEKYGDPKTWSADTMKKYKDGLYYLG